MGGIIWTNRENARSAEERTLKNMAQSRVILTGGCAVIAELVLTMRRETKATRITDEVREAVRLRDHNLCIFCKRWGAPEAHIVRRSQGGLGIEENIVCACRECHRALDEGRNRKYYQKYAEKYLKSKYPNWDRSKLVYKKYMEE